MRLIDADSLVTHEELESFGNGDYDYEFVEVVYKDDIDNAQTIEPEQKKGKWINVRDGNVAECNRCGITGRAWMNFCFNCGADMRGEQAND